MSKSKTLPPSGIGLASKYNFSPWYIKLRFDNKDPIKNRNWNQATKPLSPIQSRIGNEYEEDIYDKLNNLVYENVSSWYDWGSKKNEEQFVKKVKEVTNQNKDTKPTILTQARLSGNIGEFHISGDSDLIILFPQENNSVRIHVIDIKSSWDEKPSQQLQTATYTLLVRKMVESYDLDYNITGGILYRDTRIDSVTDEDETPEFDVRTREGDVRRVLKSDGPFTRAFNNSFDDLPLYYDKNSPYAEVTTVRAIEKNDIAILGLNPSQKKVFKELGVDTIHNIASLYQPVEDPKPYDYDEPPVNPDYEETVDILREKSGINSRISTLSQVAQSLLGELDPDFEYAHDKPWLPWIQGSGDGELPEDNPPYDDPDMNIEENSMIRVYLNVQYDHVRDEIVTLTGSATSGKFENNNSEPLDFGQCISDIDHNKDESWGELNERNLLEESIENMFNTIAFLSDYANHGSEAPIHFYVYSQREYDMLYDSIIDHENESKIINSMRNILDKRSGIDQKMFSIVEKEIETRFAPKSVNSSITSILNHMYPNIDVAKFDGWEINDKFGDNVDLSEAFEQQMFDSIAPLNSDSKKVLNYTGGNSNPDTFFDTVPRSGAQIPVEYLWASEDINILQESWTDNSSQKSIIESFMWVNRNNKEKRMCRTYYKLMSKKLSKALYCIERSIQYRNTDIKKKPIDIKNLKSLYVDNGGNLSDSCKHYLDLESNQTKKDAVEVYSKPVKKRIADGESVPMKVTNTVREEDYMFKVEGELLFEEFGFSNPKEIAGSSKLSGSDGTSGGSRCVATPLIRDSGELEPAISNPKSIAKSIKISIDNYDPDNQKITITGYRANRSLDNIYVESRKPWSLDPTEYKKTYVGPGESFILDPSPDNVMAEKSLKVLDNARFNPIYRDITKMKNTSYQSESSVFNEDNCLDYINYYKSCLDFKPNQKQRDFIENTMKYVLLQGPPGTGKTSGAISHSILSRAYDFNTKNKNLTGLVTGLSNKSVDEVLEDVSSLLEKYDSNYENHPLSNVRLVRLSYEKPDNPGNIEYLNYQKEEDLELLKRFFERGFDEKSNTVQKTLASSTEHVIIFSTPGRIETLAGKVSDNLKSEEMYEESPQVFDLITVDEASMMPMYQFFMSTQFINQKGQVLLAGDHRQLPPVQKYDWSDENRKSIIDNLPHLSVLDYFRYLKGNDNIDMVYDNTPKSPNANIPIIQLKETYRCHRVLTEFLRKTIYLKDNLEYKSNKTDLMRNVSNDFISQIINPDSPITLIIHNDRDSRQHNIPEKNIISELSKNISNEESVGVVTPHNSQKGKLSVVCPSNTEVDTVERFQGGEKDVMFLSTTVSDPSQLSDEEEFILSHRRLNVALSRMKKKLVVVAPKTVFELVPDETDVYDESRIWKSLYSVAEADKEADWSGKISDLNDKYSDTEFNVYNIYDI